MDRPAQFPEVGSFAVLDLEGEGPAAATIEERLRDGSILVRIIGRDGKDSRRIVTEDDLGDPRPLDEAERNELNRLASRKLRRSFMMPMERARLQLLRGRVANADILARRLGRKAAA